MPSYIWGQQGTRGTCIKQQCDGLLVVEHGVHQYRMAHGRKRYSTANNRRDRGGRGQRRTRGRIGLPLCQYWRLRRQGEVDHHAHWLAVIIGAGQEDMPRWCQTPLYAEACLEATRRRIEEVSQLTVGP